MFVKKFLLALAAALALTAGAAAQIVGPVSLTGTQCATIATADQPATVGMYVSGSWSGTLQPQGTIQGQAAFNLQVTPSTSSTAQSTITGNGAFVAAVAGLSTFQLCGASITGTATVFLNASRAQLSAAAAGGGGAFASLASGTNNTAAMVVGSGASLSTSGTGHVVSSQMWMPGGLVAPTFTSTQTGGSLGSGQSLIWAYTLNTAAGETGASPSVSNSPASIGSGCTSGGSCTATMVAPTIPAGYTGYTAYFCDISQAVGCSLPVKVPACANITGNCTISSPALPSGTALPTVNTAYLQPPNLQPSECPTGVIPTWFVQSVDGNWHTQAGVDPISNNISPAGTFEICRRTFFTDAQITPVGFNNAFVAIQHRAGVGTSSTNQDRALTVSIHTPTGDSSAHYGLEAIHAEIELVGTPTLNGSPDGEVTTGSFQMSFSPTASIGSALGTNGIRSHFFRQSGSAVDTGGMNGIYALFSNNSTVNGGGTGGNALKTSCNASVAGAGISCTEIAMVLANTGQFPSGLYGLRVQSNGSFAPSGTDQFIRNDQKDWPAVLGVNTYLKALFPTNATVLTSAGNFTAGGLTSIAQSAPTLNTPTCSGGASLYSYKWVLVDTNGGQVAGGTLNTASSCTNPLTGGNAVTFSQIPVPNLVNGVGFFDHADLYRTAGPMATGKIGCLGNAASACTWKLPDGLYNPALGLISGSLPTVQDTGLSADGGTAPSVNTTGSISAASFVSLGATTVANLPAAAAANAGQMYKITDSTAVAAEGQTCVGGSSNVAMAFSNGSVWKCF